MNSKLERSKGKLTIIDPLSEIPEVGAAKAAKDPKAAKEVEDEEVVAPVKKQPAKEVDDEEVVAPVKKPVNNI